MKIPNPRHQIERSEAERNPYKVGTPNKFQITSTKIQINHKIQITKPKQFVIYDFRDCDLSMICDFVIWNLLLSIQTVEPQTAHENTWRNRRGC